MEMIERYLEAVKFWLPKRQKDDIIDELSADLDAQVEEREAGLGRKLSEAEVESILKERGRPVVVANRFLPQEQLIGPLLFPVYRFVLKIICLCYLLPWALVWIGMMTFDHACRVQQTKVSWFTAFASAWSVWWTTAFVAIGIATLVFAILERVQAKSGFLNDWSPRPSFWYLRVFSHRANNINWTGLSTARCVRRLLSVRSILKAWRF